jgi:ABC-type protease/lipase transport system fused ATPase/permease subunit
VRKRSGIVIVIAHRPSAISGVDLLMVMAGGRIQAFGAKEEILAKMTQRPPAARVADLKVVRATS